MQREWSNHARLDVSVVAYSLVNRMQCTDRTKHGCDLMKVLWKIQAKTEQACGCKCVCATVRAVSGQDQKFHVSMVNLTKLTVKILSTDAAVTIEDIRVTIP